MGKKSKKQLGLSALVIFALVVLDQITKYLAVIFLKGQEAVPIIKDVFELKYLENRSAAFGMDPVSLLHKLFSFEAFNNNPALFLQVKMGFFIVLTILVVIGLCFVYTRIPNEKKFRYLNILFLFFIAGALGNFIDRISLNYVVDFLYFKLIDFPIFNVADIYVTCSAFVLVALGVFYYSDEDVEQIFPSKKKEK